MVACCCGYTVETVVIMKPSLAFENILTLMSSQGKSLPPLWQVIYYEAVRGHHILFDHLDVVEARQLESKPSQTISAEELEQLCESVVTIISCSDLASMRRAIKECPDCLRHQLFTIYRHFVEAWRQHLKCHLN